jgi:uncharacterized RDD family membrane protein YckC
MDLLNDFIPQYENASVGRRWLGACIDYIIYLFIHWFTQYLWVAFALDDDLSESMLLLTGLLALTFWIVLWFALFPVFEALNNGRTLGKAIVGVRVIKQNGGKPNFGHLLVRHLFDFVDYLPFFGIVGVIVAVNTDHKQRVGDLVAQTIVVNSR